MYYCCTQLTQHILLETFAEPYQLKIHKANINMETCYIYTHTLLYVWPRVIV